MTELDAQLARRKLATITVTSIGGRSSRDCRSLSTGPIRFDRRVSERLLQEVVEAAVDTNLQLLRAAGAPAPGDYYQSFLDVGRQGILPVALAETLAPAAGLRNRLVHESDVIDDAIVLDAVGRARRDFAVYVRAIEQYLAARGV